MAERRCTKEVRIGDVIIGGNHPIAIQSMTNTKTQDVAACTDFAAGACGLPDYPMRGT